MISLDTKESLNSSSVFPGKLIRYTRWRLSFPSSSNSSLSDADSLSIDYSFCYFKNSSLFYSNWSIFWGSINSIGSNTLELFELIYSISRHSTPGKAPFSLKSNIKVVAIDESLFRVNVWLPGVPRVVSFPKLIFFSNMETLGIFVDTL